MEMSKIGLAITDFAISSFSYPEEVRKMQEKAASQAMVGDMGKYSQLAMADSLANGNSAGAAGMGMAGMQMGMMMGQQMVNNMAQMQAQQNMMNQGMQTQNAGSQTVQPQNAQQPAGGSVPKFCPECGTPTNGAKFCPECGKKLQ
jgi:membrane protease subunit (stomatin/prohibitin family)